MFGDQLDAAWNEIFGQTEHSDVQRNGLSRYPPFSASGSSLSGPKGYIFSATELPAPPERNQCVEGLPSINCNAVQTLLSSQNEETRDHSSKDPIFRPKNPIPKSFHQLEYVFGITGTVPTSFPFTSLELASYTEAWKYHSLRIARHASAMLNHPQNAEQFSSFPPSSASDISALEHMASWSSQSNGTSYEGSSNTAYYPALSPSQAYPQVTTGIAFAPMRSISRPHSDPTYIQPRINIDANAPIQYISQQPSHERSDTLEPHSTLSTTPLPDDLPHFKQPDYLGQIAQSPSVYGGTILRRRLSTEQSSTAAVASTAPEHDHPAFTISFDANGRCVIPGCTETIKTTLKASRDAHIRKHLPSCYCCEYCWKRCNDISNLSNHLRHCNTSQNLAICLPNESQRQVMINKARAMLKSVGDAGHLSDEKIEKSLIEAIISHGPTCDADRVQTLQTCMEKSMRKRFKRTPVLTPEELDLFEIELQLEQPSPPKDRYPLIPKSNLLRPSNTLRRLQYLGLMTIRRPRDWPYESFELADDGDLRTTDIHEDTMPVELTQGTSKSLESTNDYTEAWGAKKQSVSDQVLDATQTGGNKGRKRSREDSQARAPKRSAFRKFML